MHPPVISKDDEKTVVHFAYLCPGAFRCSLTCGFCVPDGENTQVIKSSSSFEESTEDFASRGCFPRRNQPISGKRRIMRKLEKSGVTVEELRSLIRQQATTQATTTVTTTTDTVTT